MVGQDAAVVLDRLVDLEQGDAARGTGQPGAPPFPSFVATTPARTSARMMRRTTTGFVRTLAASSSELTYSAPRACR